MGHTFKFLFGIYWYTWKTTIYCCDCNGPIKNITILILTMFSLKNKIKDNTWRYYFTPMYQKSWWYDLQFLRYGTWQTESSNFGSFLPFHPPKMPKNQNFEKMKKMARDIILHMFTKNLDHKMYGCWDTEWDR